MASIRSSGLATAQTILIIERHESRTIGEKIRSRALVMFRISAGLWSCESCVVARFWKHEEYLASIICAGILRRNTRKEGNLKLCTAVIEGAVAGEELAMNVVPPSAQHPGRDRPMQDI